MQGISGRCSESSHWPGMSLRQTLLELARRHMAALPDRDRADVEDELDRLRSLRVAEQGLGLGDLLPDFALHDSTGTLRTSHEFLDRGPLLLALLRGGWCPYCDLTMVALEEARLAINGLGGAGSGGMREPLGRIDEIAKKRGIT